ncbi:organic solute transporter Ostalpha-domain-containing protein [Abortiporus biennis]|nr:organic solute transporter Ostalpha-domain-containing protein [Abortiporus biennis]
MSEDSNIVNGTCHNKKALQDGGPPLFQHGNLVFQAHHVGWILTGCFTLVAMGASFWLINKHLQWYTNKHEQRYIVRILFMVPIYAVISFASFLFWNHSTPLLLLRDCYESTVLTSFFYLLLVYLSPDPAEQKDIFRKSGLSRENDRQRRRNGEKPQKWMFPLNFFVRWKPQDGLYFLQLMKWGVLQYCVLRPLTTLAAVILDYAGLYCEDSWSPGWGHVYITVIVSISVSVAMYCLLQLYVCVSHHLKPQKPLLKLFAIKAVVFLTFWQATFVGLLVTFGVIKDTSYMTADNITIGIEAILETVEMMIFGFLHIKAFTYKPYRMPPERTPKWKAFVHAMNFKETIREVWAGTVYMTRKARGKETDAQAKREAVLESVFGKSRFNIAEDASKTAVEKGKAGGHGYDGSTKGSVEVEVDVQQTIHVGEERQWLDVGEDYGYGIRYFTRREKSESLEVQFEREMERRGYGKKHQPSKSRGIPYNPICEDQPQRAPSKKAHSRVQRSWWSRIYGRLSQSDQDHDDVEDQDYLVVPTNELPSPPPPRISGRKSRRVSDFSPVPENETYEDLPPPSVIRSYRESRRSDPKRGNQPQSTLSIPDPLSPPLLPMIGPSLSHPTSADHLASLATNSPPSGKRQGVKRKAPPVQDLSVPPIAIIPSHNLLSVPPMSPAAASDDSFLARAFAPISDASHSAEALSVPSSQSHSARRIIGTGSIVASEPMLMTPNYESGAHRSHERIVELVPGPETCQPRPVTTQQLQPQSSNKDSFQFTGRSTNVLTSTLPPPEQPKSSRLSHKRDSAGVYHERPPNNVAHNISLFPDLPSVPQPERIHISPPQATRLRREHITFPTPLAPSAPSSEQTLRPRDSISLSPASPTHASPRSHSSSRSPPLQAVMAPPPLSPPLHSSQEQAYFQESQSSPTGTTMQYTSRSPRQESARFRESRRYSQPGSKSQLHRSSRTNTRRHTYDRSMPLQAIGEFGDMTASRDLESCQYQRVGRSS